MSFFNAYSEIKITNCTDYLNKNVYASSFIKLNEHKLLSTFKLFCLLLK